MPMVNYSLIREDTIEFPPVQSRSVLGRPCGPYAVERKYETTFRYRLSDQPTSATVTFESFHKVDLVADLPQTTINY